MVIKREMSLDSVVFEEFSGGGEEEDVCDIRVSEGETEGKSVCFPIFSPATISASSVYMLFISLTYMWPCLCVCVCVCVSLHARESDKVLVHFPEIHQPLSRSDHPVLYVFSYNRVRSPDDSPHTVYAFCLTRLHLPTSSALYPAARHVK